jgi:WS/DGAT/MGAT family acyltransferase
VNDVVLTTVAGAVREFLIRRRVRPESIDFRVSAPVSVRREDSTEEMGNQVSSWIIRLPVGESSPLKRLDMLHQMTKELKESRQALGVEMMMAVAEFSPGVLLSLGSRAASGPINMIVTNVPGPQFPLYFLGAKLLYSFPAVPLLENTGLGVALFSYDGRLCWGFNADYAMLPDLADFRQCIENSFRDLSEAAGIEAEGMAKIHPIGERTTSEGA